MTIETENDLTKLKRIGRIVALALKEMKQKTKPGITTRELDEIGAKFLEKLGARSAPKLAYNFPGATCISVNEEAAHGVPGDRVIKAGDMVNIDVSAELDGYFADTGGSFVVPPHNELKIKLCHATKKALSQAMASARADQPLNHIGKAIETVARETGFTIIRNLCSHGVGRSIHEEPKEIYGYYEPRDNRRLHEGMVITIEPFLSTGATSVTEGNDGWTLSCAKGYLSAQYEHTMVITKGKPLIITAA